MSKRAQEKLREEEKDILRGYEDFEGQIMKIYAGRSEHGGKRKRTERE